MGTYSPAHSAYLIPKDAKGFVQLDCPGDTPSKYISIYSLTKSNTHLVWSPLFLSLTIGIRPSIVTLTPSVSSILLILFPHDLPHPHPVAPAAGQFCVHMGVMGGGFVLTFVAAAVEIPSAGNMREVGPLFAFVV